MHFRSRQSFSSIQAFQRCDMIWNFVCAHWGIHSQQCTMLQCFRTLIRLNMFLVPLTSIHSPFITILFHCCDIMSTASSSIHVSNKLSSFSPSSASVQYYEMILKPLCPFQLKHSPYSQSVLQWCHMLQVFSSFTPYQVHAVVYKHAVFQLCDLLQMFLESTWAETYPVAYDRWCFRAVTCFMCLFFYTVLNACNSLSPSVVSVLLHSSSLVSYTLVQIHLEVVHHQLLSSVICFNCFCRYQFIHTRTFITIQCFWAVIWLNESPSYPRSNTPSVHQHPVFQLCDTIQVLYHPFSEDTANNLSNSSASVLWIFKVFLHPNSSGKIKRL